MAEQLSVFKSEKVSLSTEEINALLKEINNHKALLNATSTSKSNGNVTRNNEIRQVVSWLREQEVKYKEMVLEDLKQMESVLQKQLSVNQMKQIEVEALSTSLQECEPASGMNTQLPPSTLLSNQCFQSAQEVHAQILS